MADQAQLDRFLNYECKWRKHAGKTWREVYNTDRSYFEWAVSRMNPTTKTYAVFLPLCAPGTEEKNKINTAFKLNRLNGGKVEEAKPKKPTYASVVKNGSQLVSFP